MELGACPFNDTIDGSAGMGVLFADEDVVVSVSVFDTVEEEDGAAAAAVPPSSTPSAAAAAAAPLSS